MAAGSVKSKAGAKAVSPGKTAGRFMPGSMAICHTMRQHLNEALGTELAASDDARALLESQLSFETWDYMRTVQDLGRRRCRQLLERAVLALLPS